MRCLVYLGLLCVMSIRTGALAQSTERVLQQRIDAQLDYAKEVVRTDRAKAQDTLLVAMKLAEELGDELYIARCYKAIAGNYRLADEFDSAIKYYELAREYWSAQNNVLEIASIKNQLGVIWRYKGEYDKALVIYDEVISIYETHGLVDKMASVYRQKAIIKKRQYEYSEALELYLSARDLAEDAKDKVLLADCYNGISGVYKAQKEYDMAREALDKALGIFQQLDDAVGQTNVYNNIGELFIRKHEFDSAIVYFDLSYALSEKQDMKNGLGIILYNKGVALRELGRYNESLEAFDEASHYFQVIGNKRSAMYPAMAITELYRMQGDLPKAKKSIDETLPLAHDLQDHLVIRNLYETLYEIQKEQTDWQGALASLEQYNIHNDSVFDEERSQQLVDIEVKYETERKEQEIASLSQENQIKALQLSRQRFLIAFIVAFAILIGVLARLSYSRYRNRSEKNKLLLEQRLLRSQMNPHFIYNAMASIQNLVLSGEKEKANLYLAKFGELTRNILDGSRQEFIPLEKELEIVQDYVDLENLRFNKSIQFSANVEGDAERLLVPPMITQPFVENAFKHGYEHDAKGRIVLNVKKGSRTLVFELLDDGKGLKEETLSNGKSLAIKITRERLGGLLKGVENPLDIFNRFNDQGEVCGVGVKLNLPIKYSI
ncbi:MAG: tetratricopeptide repeat protein [Bacteroidota bacterium]